MTPKIDLAVGIIGLLLGIAALVSSALGIGEKQIWMVALPLIAIGLNAAFRGRKNLKINQGMGVHTLAADPKAVAFLKHSYGAWQSGRLSDFNDQYELKTRKRSLALLVELLLSDKAMQTALDTAFKIIPPEKDEFFLAIVPGSYLLTNKRIYVFAEKPRVIQHEEIQHYACQPGPPPSCTFKLNSEETISSLQLDQVPSETSLDRLRTLAAQQTIKEE